ncbi:MAG: polysaccharide export protein [PVC group bacterium]|nr:polysaccharide export protein [PVC group bacterium]
MKSKYFKLYCFICYVVIGSFLLVGNSVVLAQGAKSSSAKTNFSAEAKQKRVQKKKLNPDLIKKEKHGEYTLGKDDVINITVRRHTEFSGRFPVGPNGKIQYPFVGDVDLAGLNKNQATKKITGILAKFVATPEVDITIVEYNSKVVYVVGLVGYPGKYKMRSEFMPVREAILAAGLPREHIASLRRAIIIRPVEGEKPIVKKVNLLSLLYDGNLKLNYDLRSEDIVYVPSTALYKVSTILEQIVSPFTRSSGAYNIWEEDVLYRDNEPRR